MAYSPIQNPHPVSQSGTWSITVGTALPAGSNSIGTVVLGAGAAAIGSVTVTGAVAVTGPLTDAEIRATPLPVSGTFYQATQPVSLASLPALAAGTADIGDELLGSILTELRVISTLLHIGLGVRDQVADIREDLSMTLN